MKSVLLSLLTASSLVMFGCASAPDGQALEVPHFAPNDPGVQQAGFFRHTLQVHQQVGSELEIDGKPAPQVFTLMAFAVGGTLSVGAMSRQPFDGTVRITVGDATFTFDWDSEARTVGDVRVEGLSGYRRRASSAAAGGVRWAHLEVPMQELWASGGGALAVELVGATELLGEARVRWPEDGGVYAARLAPATAN